MSNNQGQQLNQAACKSSQVDGLAERLSDTRVGHNRDPAMENLADAVGKQWVPNETYNSTKDGTKMQVDSTQKDGNANQGK